MTLSADRINERLRFLREMVADLEPLRRMPRERLLDDRISILAAQRGLQLGAEIVFDIVNHILVSVLHRSADDYEDMLVKLDARGVLSQELLRRLTGLGKFRNLLVHAYLRVDPTIVANLVATRLTDFTDFAREIDAFLARPTKS